MSLRTHVPPQELSLIDDLREIDVNFKQVQQQSDEGLAAALASLDDMVSNDTLQ